MGTFALDVRAFVEKTKKNNETVMRQVSLKLFSAIIKASPVDTGRFRMNWQAASGAAPAVRVKNGVDPSGSKAIAQMASVVSRDPNWYEFTLTNNLPYAERLEYGWSKQAPTGIVRVNITRFNALLEQEAAKVK